MALKYIDISIKIKDCVIGECTFLELSNFYDTSKIIFYNLKLTNEIRIGDRLSISIFLCKNHLMKFDVKILEVLDYDDFSFKIKYFVNNLNKFNQLYLDIFNKWSLEIETNWRDLKGIKQKNVWIRSCNILNGVSESISLRKNYVINGNHIKHPIDLHCLLGELFLGNKGYFGGDYNSFVDCLTQAGLDSSLNKIDSEIKILNYNKLDRIISKYKNYDGYLDAIILELKSSGFNIVKE